MTLLPSCGRIMRCCERLPSQSFGHLIGVGKDAGKSEQPGDQMAGIDLAQDIRAELATAAPAGPAGALYDGRGDAKASNGKRLCHFFAAVEFLAPDK